MNLPGPAPSSASGGSGAPHLALAMLLAGVLFPGCRAGVDFPPEPLAVSPQRVDFDVNGDKRADFFCFPNASGRYDRIAYDRDGDGRPDYLVNLDALDARFCRHLVLVLDGFPYEVVKEFWDGGHLRFLNPPAVVIPPYPVMTDLALEDAFGYMPCEGYEAKYFDRAKNRIVGGTGDYLAGRNEPFARLLDYRAGTLTDAFAYLNPVPEFEKEVAAVKRVWDARRRQEVIAYLVSSAAMGSRMGKGGQLAALRRCERLVNQLYYESGGLVRVTIFADHGQTNVPCKPANLQDHLRQKGWRVADSLAGPNDVALVSFGLVTSAALSTNRPAKLAEDLLASEKVELVSYAEGDAVIVASREGRARIRSGDGKTFQYQAIRGDPLKLGPLVAAPAPAAATQPAEAVALDGREIFKATSDGRHYYPDPLYRLWRGHFGLVSHPADVLVSLDDRYYNGSGALAGFVSMASTHGGLNWRNSSTFIMSSTGPIEGPLRSEDIPSVMERLQLRRRPFPDRP